MPTSLLTSSTTAVGPATTLVLTGLTNYPAPSLQRPSSSSSSRHSTLCQRHHHNHHQHRKPHHHRNNGYSSSTTSSSHSEKHDRKSPASTTDSKSQLAVLASIVTMELAEEYQKSKNLILSSKRETEVALQQTIFMQCEQQQQQQQHGSRLYDIMNIESLLSKPLSPPSTPTPPSKCDMDMAMPKMSQISGSAQPDMNLANINNSMFQQSNSIVLPPIPSFLTNSSWQSTNNNNNFNNYYNNDTTNMNNFNNATNAATTVNMWKLPHPTSNIRTHHSNKQYTKFTSPNHLPQTPPTTPPRGSFTTSPTSPTPPTFQHENDKTSTSTSTTTSTRLSKQIQSLTMIALTLLDLPSHTIALALYYVQQSYIKLLDNMVKATTTLSQDILHLENVTNAFWIGLIFADIHLRDQNMSMATWDFVRKVVVGGNSSNSNSYGNQQLVPAMSMSMSPLPSLYMQQNITLMPSTQAHIQQRNHSLFGQYQYQYQYQETIVIIEDHENINSTKFSRRLKQAGLDLFDFKISVSVEDYTLWLKVIRLHFGVMLQQHRK
ncbi:hypothetical protein HDU76_004403 [Blyttiomyces sp. JEL0837]|nr:hypothetical protein HDU76_004403 [Blyttiomyces sp. JEL0837]